MSAGAAGRISHCKSCSGEQGLQWCTSMMPVSLESESNSKLNTAFPITSSVIRENQRLHLHHPCLMPPSAAPLAPCACGCEWGPGLAPSPSPAHSLSSLSQRRSELALNRSTISATYCEQGGKGEDS